MASAGRTRALSFAREVFVFGLILTRFVDGVFGNGRGGATGFAVQFPCRRSGRYSWFCKSKEHYTFAFLTQLNESPNGVERGGEEAEGHSFGYVNTTTVSKSDDTAEVTTPINQKQTDDVVIEGIGGKGGVVYDVNRLKRNLLQETMTAYKEELWDLLAEKDDTEIVDKLLALVQASPVRTTTDSNLLDDNQDDWILAYRSQFPTTVSSLVLYDTTSDRISNYNPRYTFLWNETFPPQQQEESPSSSSLSMKAKNFIQHNVVLNKVKEFFQTKQRTFRLEDLEDDEDAFVVDTTLYLGGLITKTKRYCLNGLTRSSLSLQKVFSLWSLMGRPSTKRLNDAIEQGISDDQQQQQQQQQQSSLSVQIIYLDNDLCILTEEDGPESPFMVYTRNKAYVDAYTSMKRKLKVLTKASLGLLTLPIRGLTKAKSNQQVTYPSGGIGLQRRRRRRQRKYGTAAADDPILKEIIQSTGKPPQRSGNHNNNNTNNNNNNAVKLRVLRLGDVNDEMEDESWESESDPFVHLSADERQKILKGMSVEEVEQAADRYRNRRFRIRWLRKLAAFGSCRGRRRRQSFKKPPENWRRPVKK